MEENRTQNPDNKLILDSQIPNSLDFSQFEEIFQEYQKNKQLVLEEFMEGVNDVFSEMGKIYSDVLKASMREGKRMENLLLIIGSCCKITKEFYDTIKYHFNMPLLKKT